MARASEAARKIILSDPLLRLCISRGVASPSAVARIIAERLAGEGEEPPSMAALKMAVSRLARELRENLDSGGVEGVLARSALAVQDRIAVATYPLTMLERAARAVAGLAGKSRFVQLAQSTNSVTVMVAEEDLDRVGSGLGKPLELMRGQSAVIIVSPREIVTTPGVVAFVAGYLAAHGINITQIVSAHLDTIIIVDGRDAPRAYNVLHTLIQSLYRSAREEGI